MKFLVFLLIYTLTLKEALTKVVVPSKFPISRTPESGDSDESQLEPTTSTAAWPFSQFNVRYCLPEEFQHIYYEAHSNKPATINVAWNRTKVGQKAVLLKMCSALTGLPLKRSCRYDVQQRTAAWEPWYSHLPLVECRISMQCKEEKFEHFYILKAGQLEKHKNIWKQVSVGESSTPHDICLKANGLPLTRKCQYNPKTMRAELELYPQPRDGIKCLQKTQQHLISNDLNLLHAELSQKRADGMPMAADVQHKHLVATKVISLLEKPQQKLLPADVHLTSEILRTLVSDTSAQQDVQLTRDVMKITGNMMKSDVKTLRLSTELNATNVLLETFENYMDTISEQFVASTKCSSKSLPQPIQGDNSSAAMVAVEILNFAQIGVYGHIVNNISVFFINPNCANISGIAIYPGINHAKILSATKHQSSLHYDSFNDFHYRFIYLNETLSNIMQEKHIVLASYVPQSLWRSLSSDPSSTQDSKLFIVLKVYEHDALFVETKLERFRKPFSKILSVSIPGYEGQLPENLPFILSNRNYSSPVDSNTGCGYWNYSTWVSSGVQTFSVKNSLNEHHLVLCNTNHLTQFSYLIGGNFRQNDLSDEVYITAAHQQALDIISVIGCTLSLWGLMAIWLTALVFKRWRSQSSNKILLHMCVALTLQMILFLFVNTDDISEALVEQHSYIKCVVMGAFLQYSILVLFTWMLIVAFLQFQRYVTVIGIDRPKHYIAKSACAAWGFPLIPTLLVALIDPRSYIPTEYQLATDTGICYPSGYGLYFGIILPIGVVVIANFTIFLYVFYSISNSLSVTMQRSEKKMVIQQIRLSVLLFFLLGLSWIFGIFAFMNGGIVFSYLFCLTATIQGFILFIYFVVLEKNAREDWLNLLCPGRKKKQNMKATELHSMATTSTATSHAVPMGSSLNNGLK